jgi:hypothetical protein
MRSHCPVAILGTATLLQGAGSIVDWFSSFNRSVAIFGSATLKIYSKILVHSLFQSLSRDFRLCHCRGAPGRIATGVVFQLLSRNFRVRRGDTSGPPRTKEL